MDFLTDTERGILRWLMIGVEDDLKKRVKFYEEIMNRATGDKRKANAKECMDSFYEKLAITEKVLSRL